MIKENAYKVNNYSIDAIVACVLAAVAVICMAVALLLSYKYDGEGPAAVGLLGIGGLIFSFVGLVFSISSWKAVEGKISMKRIAVITNVIALLLGLALFVLGWA